MAELKDKELNEVTPISDPLLPGVDIPDDLLDKIVAGREDIELRSTYPDEEGFYHDGKETEADWGRN